MCIPPQICILVDATWAELHVGPGPAMIKELRKKTVDGLGTNYDLLEIDANLAMVLGPTGED